MSRRLLCVIAAFTLLLSCRLEAQNANNPLDVALLRWYQVNTTTAFSTCNTPESMIFDGAHVWVACFNISTPATSAQIEEFNKSDGKLIRTVTIPITFNTLNVTLGFDGANVWAADSDNPGKLYKIQSSTGSIVSTVSVPAYPQMGTFDGTNIWTTNGNPVGVSKINIATGTVTSTLLFNCEGDLGPVFDGTHYWVVCPQNTLVQELDSNGTELASIKVGLNPDSMAFDGTYLWVGSQGIVSRINVSTLVETGTLPGNCGAGSVVFDGTYVWSSGANCVAKIQANTGTLAGTFSTPTTNVYPFVFDGANIWSITGTSTIAKF